MYRFTPILALACVLLTGCIQTQATRLSPNQFPAVDPEMVVIYVSEEDIPGEYEKVALIHAQGSSTYTNEANMLNAAKRRAAAVGANGVVLGRVDEASNGAKVAAAVFGMDTTRRGQMLAVYVYPAADQAEEEAQ